MIIILTKEIMMTFAILSSLIADDNDWSQWRLFVDDDFWKWYYDDLYVILPDTLVFTNCRSAFAEMFWPMQCNKICNAMRFSSTGCLNLRAIYSKPKNQIAKIFFLSELKELEVRIYVQPNSPIIILILLNGFHKFAISMEAKHQCPLQFWSAFNVTWRSSIFLQ